MNIPIEQAEQYAIELRDAADCYADRCAYALAMEIQRLRADIRSLNGATRWQCACGGTDCDGQRENERMRAQLATQEQAIQERGIALAAALRERDEARAAIVALPACRCERSLDQQCELSMRLEKAERERDEAKERTAKAISVMGHDWSGELTKLRADNAALRSVVSSAVELLSADPTWDAAMAVVAQARSALAAANKRANCTLVAFDGVERTVTLQFELMPESCIGEKWVATKSKP